MAGGGDVAFVRARTVLVQSRRTLFALGGSCDGAVPTGLALDAFRYSTAGTIRSFLAGLAFLLACMGDWVGVSEQVSEWMGGCIGIGGSVDE